MDTVAGMRKGEIVTLRWPQVDLGRAVITLHETKNGERRAVPLGTHVLGELRALSKIRRIDTDLVFPGTAVSKPIEIAKAWMHILRNRTWLRSSRG
jgi:integrase